ncbi:MAG TPA: DUF3617 family protein [Allosphingosinicella sp.]|jgi:hypothetical protein
MSGRALLAALLLPLATAAAAPEALGSVEDFARAVALKPGRWLTRSAVLVAGAGLAADSRRRPEQLRQAMGLKLGEWESTVTVADVQVEPTPGADPAEAEKAAAALRPQIGTSRTHKECLWNSPDLVFIPGLRVESGCEFSRVEARNGRYAVTGICSRPEGGVRVEMAFEGSYAADSMTSHFEATTTTGQVRIRMKADAQSRYAGQCPPPVAISSPPPKP